MDVFNVKLLRSERQREQHLLQAGGVIAAAQVQGVGIGDDDEGAAVSAAFRAG